MSNHLCVDKIIAISETVSFFQGLIESSNKTPSALFMRIQARRVQKGQEPKTYRQISKEDQDAFLYNLEQVLYTYLNCFEFARLTIDYEPMYLLYHAVETANLSDKAFFIHRTMPWKTSVIISKDSVRLRKDNIEMPVIWLNQ
ncbi:hypothetical protein LMH73_009315 [Vibrio splendidus]|nr:hypothetical protein [Vibrio splendidus]MCC4881856.1 hypothetical protein [Vibrio splendidus]